MLKSVFAVLCCVAVASAIVCTPEPGTPPITPLGKGKGIFPGRVTWVHNSSCCSWGGQASDFWFQDKYVRQDVVDSMFTQSILRLTEERTLSAAFDTLFKHFNKQYYGVESGYVPGEKIAIKINLNGEFSPDYTDVNANGLSPQYLLSLLTHLIKDAGVPQDALCVYDASRWFTPAYYDKSHSAFPNVHYVDTAGLKGREKVQVDESSYFEFSSDEVPARYVTKLPTCLTQSRYVILVDNMRGHDLAGVTLSGKNWFGSIYRPIPGVDCDQAGYWCPMSIHDFVDSLNRTMGSYNVLVDLLGHSQMGGKVMLFLADGLYSGGDELTETLPIKFLSHPFDNWWASSVLASQDPLAIDSVMFDLLRNEPNIPHARDGCVDNYLHEAAQVPHPPSRTVYNPTGHKVLEALGVHEHWNNVNEKKYSRNLGKPEGIELIQLLQ